MTEKAKENKNVPKWKKVYNVVSGIVTGVIFIFLIFVIVIVIWQKSGGKDVSIFGYYMYEVQTPSMQPTINPGDLILGKKTDTEHLRKGEIITFTAPTGIFAGQNVTHRIYNVVYKDDGITVDYYETKGDAAPDNAPPDNWQIYPSGVKSVYVKNLHALAAFRSFLMTPAGYVVLIVLPLLTVGIIFIVGFVRDKTKQIAEKEAEEKGSKPVELSELSDEQKRRLAEDYLSKKDKENDGSADRED